MKKRTRRLFVALVAVMLILVGLRFSLRGQTGLLQTVGAADTTFDPTGTSGFCIHERTKIINQKEATCLENGYTGDAYCLDCEMTVEFGKSTPALGHETEIDPVVSPTCTEKGKSQGSHCLRCKKILVAQREISALGHDLVEDVAVLEPTCNQKGRTASFHCSRCDYTITSKTLLALGHEFVSDNNGKEPTCTESGLAPSKSCTRCGYVAAQRELPALGHYEVKDSAVSATCTEGGKTAGSHCERCGKVFTAQKATAPLGHSFKTTVKKATLSSDGKLTKKCIRCDEETSSVISKIKTVSVSSAVYTGKAAEATVTVKDANGKKLKKGRDFTVTYSKNVALGKKATAKINFIGNYSGTKKLSFSVLPGATSKLTVKPTETTAKVSWKKVEGATKYVVGIYKGKKLLKKVETAKTSLKFGKLSPGTDYKIVVEAVAVVGKKTYSAEKTKTVKFSTRPLAPSFEITAGKKSAALSWEKVSGATGYTIYYSDKKNGTFKKLSTEKTKLTVKKLTSKKTYFFKMTAERKGTSSAFSNVVSIKIK